MAMEYFKDCIEPKLPELPYFGGEFFDLAGTFSCTYQNEFIYLLQWFVIHIYNRYLI
jgi:hypothetical protein